MPLMLMVFFISVLVDLVPPGDRYLATLPRFDFLGGIRSDAGLDFAQNQPMLLDLPEKAYCIVDGEKSPHQTYHHDNHDRHWRENCNQHTDRDESKRRKEGVPEIVPMRLQSRLQFHFSELQTFLV